MGAFMFVVYDVPNPPIDMSFMKSFLEMRGLSDNVETQFVTSSTALIGQHNVNQVSMQLSRRKIAEYRPLTCIYGSHRLPVNDNTLDATQPFEDPIQHQLRNYRELMNRPHRKLMAVGEVYNYAKLVSDNNFGERDLQSKCDVEVILPMYIKHGIEETLHQINGDYTFVITEGVQSNNVNLENVNVYVARDSLGTRPLYVAQYKKGLFYIFVSELKGLPQSILKSSDFDIFEFPIGHYWSYQVATNNQNGFVKYIDLADKSCINSCTITRADPSTLKNIYDNIKEKIETSLSDRAWTEKPVPLGVLLSGGFDSSILLSVLAKVLKQRDHDFNAYPLYAYTLGLDEQETMYAIKCVEHVEKTYGIDIQHHIIQISGPQVLYKNLDKTIKVLETDDVNIIRQGVLLSALFDYVKSRSQVQILFSGDGLDELCNGDNVDDEIYQIKSVDDLIKLSKTDIMRNEKLAKFYGLEVRYPFLDKDIISYLLSIHPKMRKPKVYHISQPPIEKYIVRKAFDDNNNEHFYLPDEILWLKKQPPLQYAELEQALASYFDQVYTNENVFEYGESNSRNVVIQSKEQLHYRKVFEMMYK